MREHAHSGFWQVATIMEVQAYPLAAGEGPSSVRYDITVRVGNIEYVVLYVPPKFAFKESIEYQLGLESLVLIGAETMKYNDILGNTREAPILSRRTIAARSLAN